LAKYTLNTNDEDLDFALIGLTLHENQYEAVIALNEALNIDLCLSDNITLNLKDNKVFIFSLFNFIPNTSNFEAPNINDPVASGLFDGLEIEESVKLIKELPKTDYFLILKGEELHYFQHKIIEKLKEIKEILQIQVIDVSELPSKRNLVF
jgi:hypothetical protein